jgi:hypothetical protein
MHLSIIAEYQLACHCADLKNGGSGYPLNYLTLINAAPCLGTSTV